MKYFVFVIFFLINAQVIGQSYINKSKEKSKKIWNKGFKNYDLVETDTTLQLITTDTSYSRLIIILKFNPKGKCIQEVLQFSCDSCFQLVLNKKLSNKLYGWQSVQDNFYVSKFLYRLTIETKFAGNNFIISEEYHPIWTKKEYNKLVLKAR